MADLGFRALAPIVYTPGTTWETFATVPPGKEWKVHVWRATNFNASGQPMFSAALGGGGEIAVNEVLPTPTATQSGTKNIVGPDAIPLAPGTTLRARASVANAVRMIVTVMERDL